MILSRAQSSVRSVRRSRLLAGSALALSVVFVATGCSASGVKLGESQVVGAKSSGKGKTDAKIDLTVVSAKKASSAELGTKSATTYGTVYFVTYRARKTEGTYGADDTYPFSAYKWSANKGLKTLNILGSSPDGCKRFSSDDAAQLADGKTIEACTIFVADKSDVTLDTVAYGRPTVSYKGRDKGWRWSVPAS